MSAIANPNPLPHRIERETQRADVVLVVSPVTDDRFLHPILRQRGLTFQRVEYSMASWEDREEFNTLRQITEWRTLPQVFVGGRFVGGVSELLELLAEERGVALSAAPAFEEPEANPLGYAKPSLAEPHLLPSGATAARLTGNFAGRTH